MNHAAAITANRSSRKQTHNLFETIQTTQSAAMDAYPEFESFISAQRFMASTRAGNDKEQQRRIETRRHLKNLDTAVERMAYIVYIEATNPNADTEASLTSARENLHKSFSDLVMHATWNPLQTITPKNEITTRRDQLLEALPKVEIAMRSYLKSIGIDRATQTPARP